MTIGTLPSTWGQGDAGEVVGALLCYTFEELGQEAVAAIADGPNTASRRMLERAGFRKSPRRQDRSIRSLVMR
jgi:RimJ/RimL family protein N-acetyltransferase